MLQMRGRSCPLSAKCQPIVPGILNGISSWDRDTWLCSIHFRSCLQEERGWGDPVAKLAINLAAAGLSVPWLGLLADLWSFISNDRIHFVNNSLFTNLAYHPIFLNYQDYVLARWIRDPGMDQLRRSVAGRSNSRKIAALMLLLESWADHGIPMGVPVSVGTLATLTGELYRLEVSTSDRDSLENWPVPLTQAINEFCQGFRSISGPVDLGSAELIDRGLEGVEKAPRIHLRQIIFAQQKMRECLRSLELWPGAGSPRSRANDSISGPIPLGGYNTLATSGRWESLLPSQLAGLDVAVGPWTYFDIKHFRNELLYYGRADNPLSNRRRNVAFLLDRSLSEGRTKNRNLPSQSLTLLMASLLFLWELINQGLPGVDLRLTFVFVGCSHDLVSEKRLLEMVVQSDLAEGRVRLEQVETPGLPGWLDTFENTNGHTSVVSVTGSQSRPHGECVSAEKPGIILKGGNLLSRDGWTTGRHDLPPWPDQWAAIIGHLAETLAFA